MFPTTELNKISVVGSYSGASATNLDKMAVRDIEDELSNISGIDKMESTITPGRFTIILTLSESVDRVLILSRVKDSISATKHYLPQDMDEPLARLLDKSKSLIKVAISSQSLSRGELTALAQKVKSKLTKVKDVNSISIRGDSKEELLISLNSDAIIAYELNPALVITAISGLSYIFPVGEIQERGSFAYVSTVNGKLHVEDYIDTTLHVEGKYIRLGDIATVKKHYPQTKTLSTYNNQSTLTLVISKGEDGDSSRVIKKLKEEANKLSLVHKELIFDFYQDSSIPMQNRLDTVISNLMFGLILVFFSMFILINLRIAFIVVIGIPFSFIIGLLFIYHLGYSINNISLLGALIVIGIVVDDAIVVSENIQRHINEGMEAKEASLQGVKEMLLPISIATLTTVFAFLPILLMSGEMALFLVLIPIVVIMILFGSLLESFLFLPLHAQEFLKKSSSFIDWQPLENGYKKALHLLIRYKKSSIAIFIIAIPIFTIITAKSMQFQFFPNFDGNNLYISAKLDINTPIEDTFLIAKEMEKHIQRYSQELGVKSTSTSTGYRRSLSGETEFNNNVFYITVELYEKVKSNWVDRYVNPVLNFSFDFDDFNYRRELKTFELAPKAEKIIAHFKDKYKMVELGVMEDKAGFIRNDIQINLSGSNDASLERAIKKLSVEMAKIDGVVNFSDNIKYGKMEFKIKVNSYAEELGLNEVGIARLLSKYFLQKREGTTFNENGVMDIVVEDKNIDKTEALRKFSIPLKDGRFVTLSEVADIIIIRDYEKINKLNGEIVKTLFAKVDKRIITPTEILEQLQKPLSEIRESGISVDLLGENEKKKELKDDMKSSLVLAIFLILVTLLLIFSKIKYAVMILSVIPLSILGALLGHKLLGMNLSMPSLIGILGLAGVVVNDGVIMLDFLIKSRSDEEFYQRATLRLRPIIITSVTTFLGLFTLIFYASGQAVILQPIAISIGFGLLWGTLLNLFYIPALYAVANKIR